MTIDESGSLQNDFTSNVPGDADDNDTSLALPTDFSSRLTALSAGTAIEVALSGYNGSNTGTNAVLVTGTGTVTDIAFTDSLGNALNGTDSEFNTLDGHDILLYTDTVNNILLGKDATDGTIVFAAYLEETAEGAKIWLVQYEAIAHPDAANPDDALDLTGKVYVTVSQASDFSLENAPAGQNLFMMFGGSDAAIIVTGKNPANQSTGASINTGDTVNTSQGGGGTTIGTNNQMIDPGEGMYFTFVTGANPNYTVPNLSQGEADVEANIEFDDVLDADSASFRIAQLQSGKSATVKITAYTTDAEEGAAFVDGLGDGDDLAVNITQVIVKDANGDPATGITINLDGDSAVIIGVKAGYTIEYFTDGDHNRVLIENTGSGQNKAAFDIGGFSLNEGTTTTTEIGSHMVFEDDGPSLQAVAATSGLLVDETDLGTNDTADFSSLFTPTYGADGQGTVGSYTLAVKAGSAPDSGLDDTATGQSIWLYKDGNDVVGRVGSGGVADPNGAVAFRVSVDSGTGVVTLDQVRAVMHDLDGGPGGNPDAHDDAKGLTGSNLITLSAVVTDGDGDTNTASADITAAISFEDDGPAVSASLVDVHPLTTDDTATPTSSDGPTTFADLFSPDFGEDGFLDANHDGVADANAITYALALKDGGSNVASGLTDTLSGDAVVMNKDGDDIVGTIDGGATEVFRITLDTDTGAVTLTQYRAVVHDDPNDPVESGSSAAVLSAADLVTLTATITDGDGDTATATRDIGAAFHFQDDGPTFSSITNIYGFNGTTPMQGQYAASVGADGVANLAANGLRLLSLTGQTGEVDGGTDHRDIANASVEWSSEDAVSVTYTFSFDYYPFPEPSTDSETATGKVIFNKADGTYEFKLDNPITTFTTYSTSDPATTLNYNTIGNNSPEIVVQGYADEPGGPILFYGVLTARAPVSPSDTSDLETQVPGGSTQDGSYSVGDIFAMVSTTEDNTAYVNVATNTLGVNSDTIQHGELLNYDFYVENPVTGPTSPPASPGASINPSAKRAYVDELAITLDQITAGEDIAVLLKLYNAEAGVNGLAEYTTRLLIANSATDYQTVGGYKVVTIDEGDYDAAHYQIYGVQVLSSTEEVTGSGYSLSTGDEVTLTASGSNYQDTADSDVMKIIKIDVRVMTPADAELTFTGEVVDGDGDSVPFSFDVFLENHSDSLYGSAEADYLNGSDQNNLLAGGGGNDILVGGDGRDIFLFAESDGGGVDTILNFDKTANTGDVLDVSDLLVGYVDGSSVKLDFVNAETVDGDTIVSVDRDGGGATYAFEAIAILQGVNVNIDSLLSGENIDLKT